MRGVGSVIALVIVAAIGMVIYKGYFSQLQATGTQAAAPTQNVNVTGVKGDLLAIAQAERIYQTQHGSYGSTSDLTSSGALALSKPGRAGYTYDVETSASTFRVVAHCDSAAMPGCMNWSVDDTMQVQPAQ